MVEPAGAAETAAFSVLFYTQNSLLAKTGSDKHGKSRGKEWCFLQALTEGALNFGLDTLNLYAGWLGTGQETRLHFPTVCITKKDRFAKTGSGQTPGKVGKGRRGVLCTYLVGNSSFAPTMEFYNRHAGQKNPATARGKRQRRVFAPFYTRKDRFAKTGSGQI